MTSPQATSALLKAGAKAPAFDLPAFVQGQAAGNIKLSDYAGKKNVILAFYPKDDTPGCTKEMCAFSEDLEAFEKLHTQLLGISCDGLSAHEKFGKKYNLKQPLLADVGGVTGKAFGTVVEGKATANRVLFVIDKSGTIVHVVEGMPTNAELLEIARGLK
jgi:thioredoxin-dependent peroxiredoxin